MYNHLIDFEKARKELEELPIEELLSNLKYIKERNCDEIIVPDYVDSLLFELECIIVFLLGSRFADNQANLE